MGTATEKQINFITTLASEREIPEPFASGVRRRLTDGNLSASDASKWITYLTALPRKARPTTPWAAVQEALTDVEVSFYAIPASYLVTSGIDLRGNDHLFVRVRNYMGKRMLSRVHGSVGGFAYTRLSPKTALTVASVIRGNHVEFAHNFHQVTGRCGRCAAELTDLKSREAGLGPDCRKVWGL